MVQPTGPALYSHTLLHHSRPANLARRKSSSTAPYSPVAKSMLEKPHTVMRPISTVIIAPGVASPRGKHIARECPISVILLSHDDFPIRGTRRDNDTPPSAGYIGESGNFLRGSSPGLLVGASVCPPCTIHINKHRTAGQSNHQTKHSPPESHT